MLTKFFSNFNKLPLSNKSMVYLMWIYWVWELITGIFINIYVFKLYNSFENILIYNMIFFTATFIWFSGLWLLMSVFKKDIKNMYYISYILFILSFLELFVFKWTLFWVYLFSGIFGLWNWIFRCGVHTQELKNILNKNRDFFSSSISAWENIISILTPLFTAFIFGIAKIYNFDWYLILFLFLPLIYLISFIFIKNIDSYIPNKISKEDFTNFFNLRKYKYWHLYFLFWWFKLAVTTVIISAVSITLLKSEINIWLFQAILALISTFLVIHLSHKREENNRLKYYFIFCFLLFLVYLLFWIFFSLINFIIFSLILIFLKPLFRVSSHVYDLSLMDSIKAWNNDFYPAMLLREAVLWIWRIGSLLILLFIFKNMNLTLELNLKIWLIISWIVFIFLYWSIYFWEKKEKNNSWF